MPLSVSDGLGAWVDDFKKSDAPQFNDKSAKERREMAIAAYISAKRGDKNEAYNNPPFTPDSPKKTVKNSDQTKQSPMSRTRALAKRARDAQKPNENTEAKVHGKEVFDKTFANRTQADNFAQKNGGRVKQLGRVFYVFKEAKEPSLKSTDYPKGTSQSAQAWKDKHAEKKKVPALKSTDYPKGTSMSATAWKKKNEDAVKESVELDEAFSAEFDK